MRRGPALAMVVLTVLAVLGGAGSAAASPSDPYQWKGTFDTASLPSGLSAAGSIAVNRATGRVYVSDPVQGTINQFDSEGHPVDFASSGSPTIAAGATGSEVELFIDNSVGPGQGNIYVFAPNQVAGNEYFWAYSASGEPLAANPRAFFYNPIEGFTGAMTIGPDGKLWAFYQSFNDGLTHVAQLTTAGDFAGPDFATPVPIGVFSSSAATADGLGGFYLRGSSSVAKYDSSANFELLGETGLPYSQYLRVDPTTNDLFSRQGSRILGVHHTDPLVEAEPFELIGQLSGSGGFDFDATAETLYVGEGSRVSRFHREPPTAPTDLSTVRVKGIRSDRAEVGGKLTAGGAPSSYYFEYGTDTSYGQSTVPADAPFSYFPVDVDGVLEGLQRDTTYHVRLVATNEVGTTYGPDKTFHTFPLPPGGTDSCPNALARKQTAAQALPSCRAYELVSASDPGGYDVESYLAPGQTPFPGFPLARDRVLYAVHSGAVPGPWNPTNHGPDPYVATRSENGWTTDYKGLPADIQPGAGSFSSELGEADSPLDTLAFAGPNLCDPCFSTGLRTGIPLRLSNGQLVQGMTGSLAGSVDPSAKPEGKVAKYFSQDGQHLVFASKYAFEPGANGNGELTVYDRNLATGSTQIVSTNENGDVLTGTVSELDISADGSRIVTATKLGEASPGHDLVHPYLHIGTDQASVDLAPKATAGVQYAGMSADGSRIFFTSADELVTGDTDSSADLYEAAVDGSGELTLSLVSDGTNPVSDACNPVANSNGAHWNGSGSAGDCSAVAISGGGGVAADTGAVYFLSPEQLDGSAGALNQPNLYLAQPGESPTFVATLEPDSPLVLDSVSAPEERRTGDFQVTASGRYAAFASARPLTGVDHFDLRNVFRYDAIADQLACPSCDASGTTDNQLADDVELSPVGLSLISDGTVFFTTRFPLVLSDANGLKDVYQWDGEKQLLISSGIGSFDSALLTASADGTDVFFFTHDTLAPEEDHAGALMKIYDARAGGGFFKLPAQVPCQASDECHGPESPAGPVPDIRSSGQTTRGNVVACPKRKVRKHGHCVKRHRRHGKKKNRKKRAGARKAHAGASGKQGGGNA